MNRLQSTLSTSKAPKLVPYYKQSKPESRLNKSSQDLRASRELVTWGLTKNDNHYESTYSRHHNTTISPAMRSEVFIEPASPPPHNLSASFIPFETPKFTTGSGRRNDASRNTSDLSGSESPRSGRKQFSEIRHKDDYTKDDSPDSYLLFHNDHVPRKHRDNNPAHIMKKIHVFHSQVQENFMSAPPAYSHFDDHARIHSEAIDEKNTAGSSDLKKRMFPKRTGRKLMTSPRGESDLQDILRHSYSSVDGAHHTKKEFKLLAQGSFQDLKLRKPEYHERYTKNFHLVRSVTSVSPTRVRQESVHSRKSASQERSFGPNQSFRNERLNDSTEHRFFVDKSFSDLPMNSESQVFNRVDPNNSTSILLNKSYADASMYRTLPETLPETELKTEKSLRSVPLSSQSRLRSPVKNYESYKKNRDQPVEKKLLVPKSTVSTVKTLTFGSQPAKRVSASNAFLSGRITMKQGAFSGVNKKYIA